MGKKYVEYRDTDTVVIREQSYTRAFLEQRYLNDNASCDELMQELGVSRPVLSRIIKYFHLQKDRHLAEELAKKTCREHYGTDYYTQTDDYQQRRKETCLEKYGCEWATQADSVKDKFRSTCLERYGTMTTATLPEVIEKRKQTCQERYGVENPAQNDLVKQRLRETMRTKYGVDYYSQTDDFKQRARDTMVERYGGWFSSTENGRECIRRANMERFGVENPNQRHLPHTALEIVQSRESFQDYLDAWPHKPTIQEIADDLGAARGWVDAHLLKYGLNEAVRATSGFSAAELEIRNLLRQWGVKCQKTRKVLDNMSEIDIYCPDFKIGIEYNGTYWHSDAYKDAQYHFEKTQAAAAKGIRLIHIYEYEWNDPQKRLIIESFLRITFSHVPVRIFARNCEVRLITNAQAKTFNEANHLQGHRNAQVTLGLFYRDQLVQLMSFSRSKYNRNLNSDQDWEIVRGCPGSNNIVVGGVSKLFAHFCREYHPATVFSYCDYNKFDGASYEAIGMQFCGFTGPDMKWILPGGTVVARQPKKHGELQKQAVGRIFGAGSKKYIWTNPAIKN